MNILVVEDDRDLVDLLNFALRRAGFGVQLAHDVPTALRLLEQSHPDLAILDVNLGGGSGLRQPRTKYNPKRKGRPGGRP